jgi:hypothetical protein
MHYDKLSTLAAISGTPPVAGKTRNAVSFSEDSKEISSRTVSRSWDPWRVFQMFIFPALGGLLFGYDIGATSYVITQLQDPVFSGTKWHDVIADRYVPREGMDLHVLMCRCPLVQCVLKRRRYFCWSRRCSNRLIHRL